MGFSRKRIYSVAYEELKMYHSPQNLLKAPPYRKFTLFDTHRLQRNKSFGKPGHFL